MRVSTLVALTAVSLWGLSLTAPVDAGTVRPSAPFLPGANIAGDELGSLANTPSSFDPSSGGYLFESAGFARVVGNAGCNEGVPDVGRGSGGGGSKHRHSPPDSNPCGHEPGTPSTVAVVLHPFLATPGCSNGGVQPAGQPVGGSSGKKRHQAPMTQTPCRPRAVSTDADPMVLSMTFGSGVTERSLPPDESTNPGGGSNGKHRHSPPSPPQIPGASSSQVAVAGTPEPGGLVLLGSGLLMMALVRRRRRIRATPPAR